HNHNFNAQQLAQKLSISTEIVATLTRNPDLDFGHRQLNLRGTMSIDHINPASWKGNYGVGDVSLSKIWSEAAISATAILGCIFNSSTIVDFRQWFSSTDQDFLRPFGGKYVGTMFDDDDASRVDQLVEDNTNLDRTEQYSDTDANDDNDYNSLHLGSFDEYLDLHESMHAEDQNSFNNCFLDSGSCQ
ncbi:hypothetical protein C8R42DRAFT_576660, partial [Lentinula raphanica]